MNSKSLFVSIAVSLLAASSATSFAQLGADSLSEFRAFTKDLTALTGEFTQEVRDKNGRVSRNSTGSFVISRPGKFKFTYVKPYKQTIISDGVTVWLHDEDLNQVTVRTIGDSLAEQPLALLVDPQSADKLFDLKAAPAEGSLRVVSANAKKADAAVKEIAITLVGGQPAELVWRDGWQNVNTLRFASLSRNQRIDNAIFKFVVPKGADVLKQ